MQTLLSLSSRRLIAQFNNAPVERAAVDTMQRLIRHHTKRGESDPEAVSLGVLQHLKTFSYAASQPNAVFNSGGNLNFTRRENYLANNSHTAYGDWDLPSTHWISKNFRGSDVDSDNLRLSLFNLNSALMAQGAALENKNVITFTEDLNVVKSPKSIWARAEFPALLQESLNNPKASQTTIIGLPVTVLTKELGQQHLENPHVIYPMSHAFGVIVGDGTHLSPRLLENHDVTIKLRNLQTSNLESVSLAHFPPDSVQKFYFGFQPTQQAQSIPTALTSAQWQPSSATPSQQSTTPGTPGPQASMLGATPTQTTISVPTSQQPTAPSQQPTTPGTPGPQASMLGATPTQTTISMPTSQQPTAQSQQPTTPGTPGPQASMLGATPTQTTISVPTPTPEKLINDHTHPENALFQQALSGVHQLDTQQGRKQDVHSEQLAAALTVAAHRDGLKQIDRVTLSQDSKHAFAIEGDPKTLSHRQTSVATLDALNTSIEKSSQALAQEKITGIQARPTLDDPRHSAHPAHAEFQDVRQLVTDLHAKHGVPLSEEQRDRLAAAVIHDSQNNQLGSVKELRFSEDKAGKIQPDGNIFAFNGDPTKVTTLHSATHIPQAQETPVEQSFKQMAGVAQQQQQQQSQQQQPQQPQQPQAQGPTPGGGQHGGR